VESPHLLIQRLAQPAHGGGRYRVVEKRLGDLAHPAGGNPGQEKIPDRLIHFPQAAPLARQNPGAYDPAAARRRHALEHRESGHHLAAVREWLLRIPARLVRSGRRWVLRLSAHYRHLKLFLRAHHRLRAGPIFA